MSLYLGQWQRLYAGIDKVCFQSIYQCLSVSLRFNDMKQLFALEKDFIQYILMKKNIHM